MSCSLSFSRTALSASSTPRRSARTGAVSVTASAESELKARQASARAWVTPWLEAKKGGGGGGGGSGAGEAKKPNRPAAAVAAAAAAPSSSSKPAAARPAAAGGKVKGGEVMADGSVMYRF